MEQFATEEQQVEAIKRFWKENGIVIIAGAVIGLGGLWGWRYFQQTQIDAKHLASTGYEQAVKELDGDAGYESLNAFSAETESQAYGALSKLTLAQQHIEDENLDGAASELQAVAESYSGSPLGSIAGIRLARVQLAQEKYDDALNNLSKLTDPEFVATVETLKGDILVKQEKYDQARQAYIAALAEDENNRVLQMKLDNLGVMSGA